MGIIARILTVIWVALVQWVTAGRGFEREGKDESSKDL